MRERTRIRSGLRPRLDDPYLDSKAYPEPTICPKCGLVYRDKRWTRDDAYYKKVEKKATRRLCPACRKIRDHFAMGVVYLSGDFLNGHKEEIVNLMQNIAEGEFRYNPLERIMEMKEDERGMEVRTTSEHLAMGIGRAVQRAFGGELRYAFSYEEKRVRVYWSRNSGTTRKEE